MEQNLGVVKGATGATGATGAAGKDGADGKVVTTPATDVPDTGSSISGRCVAALVGWGLPLVALVPLGLAANMGLPGISPAVEQAQQMAAAAANSIPQLGALNAQMGNAGMILGGVAALGALAAVVATLTAACSPNGGSSN